MKREEIIRLAREAGWPSMVVDNLPESQDMQRLERFAALVAAAEREAIIGLLDGIDRDQCSDGWWETSTGEEFGASIIAAIRARGAA